MILLRVPTNILPPSSDSEEQICFWAEKLDCLYVDRLISLPRYDLSSRGGGICWNSEVFRLDLDSWSDTSLEGFAENRARFVNSYGKKLDLKPEILTCLMLSTDGEREDVLIRRLSLEDETKKLVSANVNDNTFTSVQIKALDNFQVQSSCISIDRKNQQMLCHDSKLNILWSQELAQVYKKFVSVPHYEVVAFKDGFLVNLGAVSRKMASYTRFSGKIEQKMQTQESCFAHYELSTGELVWKLILPGEIHRYLLHGDDVYVCNAYQLFRICGDTGEILLSVDFDVAQQVMIPGHTNNLFIHNEHLYFGHVRDQKLFVLSIPSLECIADIELIDGWRWKKASKATYHALADKIFFPMERYGRGCTNEGVLELDSNNLHEKMEVEQGPEFSVEVIDSGSISEEKELLICTHENRFDEVIRFGEIHTRDEAYEHGVSVLSSFTFTEGFNGVVNFHYKGRDPDCDDVEEKLQIMEKRFAIWANEFYLSADRTRDCQLVARWIKG